MKKIVLSALAMVLIYAVICSLTFSPLFGIRVNMTKSLPYRLFLSRRASQIKQGQYVLLTHPYTTTPLAKQVLGMCGDVVTVQKGYVYLNTERLGRVLERSKSNRVFTPTSETQIKEGYVFVYAPHEESFDSRYQEFGLIKEEQIKEILWPIF